ncbi:ABC transporter substrate-binding protein [Roseibacterium sp. SDUM158016]|uniref:ABC transporter substrate-binding protein n=1 Tax=Roseicyclus sediminis TaxID=2980997 RepID=UPI0021D39122|nr:ABC transporter substrate-binding protein [Roseibacterium sp. SDUM158016]MCU4651796.1 ABC transporter substrate-binding protein [Roseibacterium sp. SDUM158016]
MTRPVFHRSPTPALHLKRRELLQGAGALAGLGYMTLGAAGPLRAQSLDSVVHQLGWIKSIQFGGHFAAIHNGYFEEEGIEAEFLTGGPNAIGTDVAIATGQADTSDTDVPGTIRSRAGGMPIKAFAAIMQRAPGAIMSLAESPLSSISDFPGKTIAIPTGLQPQIDALMTSAGLDPASVTYVPVGTDPGMLAAGQVDGYYGWATNQGVMLMTRGVDINIAYMNDLGIPGYAGVITATDETIAERGDVLIRWLKAEIRGWQWHLENPEEMAELMVSTYGQRGLDLEAQTVESRLMADFVPIGDAAENGLLWLDPGVFQQGIDFEVASGGLEAAAVSLEDVVTQDLIAAAHGAA